VVNYPPTAKLMGWASRVITPTTANMLGNQLFLGIGWVNSIFERFKHITKIQYYFDKTIILFKFTKCKCKRGRLHLVPVIKS
jgi:hypothetical protein